VLGLYPGAVLDSDPAVDEWKDLHPAYPAYAMNTRLHTGQHVMMGSEGFAGATAFANARLLPGTEDPDLSEGGVNAEFLTFHVRCPELPGQSSIRMIPGR
jgi:hypothetical protein